MKIKVICLLIGILSFVTVRAQQSYRVGDVLYGKNGEKQGVIFWINPEGSGGWAVAMEDSGTPCYYAPTGSDLPLDLTATIWAAKADFNGHGHTVKLRNFLGPGNEYAAQRVDFENGWYLPSVGQMSILMSVQIFINSALVRNGGSELNHIWSEDNPQQTSYWTSNMYRIDGFVYYGDFDEGGFFLMANIKNVNVKDKFHVRAIRDFKIEEGVSDYTYQWNTGATSANISTTPQEGRNDYNLRVTSVRGQCSASAQKSVMVASPGVTVFKDTICKGQTYHKNGFNTAQQGIHNMTLTLADGCSVELELKLTVADTAYTLLTDRFCKGIPYNKNNFTAYYPGTYIQRWKTQQGCDSTVALRLTENIPFDTTYNESVCAGKTFEKYGFKIASVARDTVCWRRASTPEGCDSVTCLQLSVRTPARLFLYDSVCVGKPYSGFDHFHLSGITKDTVCQYITRSVNGCDSTIYLHLETLDHYPEKFVRASICLGNAYTDYGFHLTEAGEYETSITSAAGCDTLVHLSLVVHEGVETFLNDSVCIGKPYSGFDHFHLSGITKDTVCEYVTQSVNGCDSTIFLHLKALTKLSKFVQASICSGNTYTGHGLHLTEAGEYETTIVSALGCDTLVHLSLTVNEKAETFLNDSVCDGKIYAGHPQFVLPPITKDSLCFLNLTTAMGCDSLINLYLRWLPLQTKLVEVKIKKGDVYTGYGLNTGKTGDYVVNWPALAGCDTTVEIRLSLLPDAEKYVETFICEGEHYTDYGFDRAVAGLDTSIIAGFEGSDTIVYLNLKVHPVYQLEKEDVFCEGEHYTNYGLNVNEAGEYPVSMKSVYGCDSILLLALKMNPAWNTLVDTTIDKGDIFALGDFITGQEGEYIFRYKSKQGCDSTVIVHLYLSEPLWIPNTFSPNGDGVNDVFMKGYRVRIVNRNGIEIFSGDNGWDGTRGGQPVSEETYFYELFYVKGQKEEPYKGYITVVK